NLLSPPPREMHFRVRFLRTGDVEQHVVLVDAVCDGYRIKAVKRMSGSRLAGELRCKAGVAESGLPRIQELRIVRELGWGGYDGAPAPFQGWAVSPGRDPGALHLANVLGPFGAGPSACKTCATCHPVPSL